MEDSRAVRYRWALKIVVPLLCLLLLAAWLFLHLEVFRTLGLRCFNEDFVVYWSAGRVFLQGGNPYDLNQLQQQYRLITPYWQAMQHAWNPPWLFTLLAPLASLPFTVAAHIWLIASLGLLPVAGVLAWKIVSEQPVRILPCVLASLCFVPAWEALWWGQLAIVLTVLLFGAILALKRRSDWLAGALLMIVTVKPHPGYLVMCVAALLVILERRWRVAAGFIGCLIALVAASEALHRGIIQEWMAFGRLPLAWYGHTGVGALRVALSGSFGDGVVWLQLAVPALTAVCTLAAMLGRGARINLAACLPWLVCVSLITAPYGYICDFVPLLAMQIYLVSAASFRIHLELWLIQLLSVILSVWFLQGRFAAYVLIPVLYLASYLGRNGLRSFRVNH